MDEKLGEKLSASFEQILRKKETMERKKGWKVTGTGLGKERMKV